MKNETSQEAMFAGWMIIEQLGHRRVAGYIREVTLAGHGFLRVDIPGEGETLQVTQYINPTTIYALTPTTEPIARAVALANNPQPVRRWELPAPVDQEPSHFEPFKTLSQEDVCDDIDSINNEL